MNQSILFSMIAQKYSEVNLDNTVKLLVRCKQLLVSRKIAYGTLKGIMDFENNTKKLKDDVNYFLEHSPKDGDLAAIKDLATIKIAGQTQ